MGESRTSLSPVLPPVPEHPMFYGKIVPLNREVHRDLRLDVGAQRFGFAAGAHLIPAVVDEFVAAAHHLPIVFVPGPNQPSPVFLVGVRPGENRFVGADGRWIGGYIPAFVRRYPFIIGEVAGAEPVVCVDEMLPWHPDGEPLFVDGKDTPVLQANIALMNDYLAAAKRTEALVKSLLSFDLFRSVTIEVRDATGAQTLHGMMTVDIDKLPKLADADFLALRSNGALPALYAQAGSLAEVVRLSPAIGSGLGSS